jgi:hypothetical protein
MMGLAFGYFNERVESCFYDKRVNTKSNTQHKNLNVSYTVYGTNSSNLSGSISRDSSTSTSQQTTHNNTNLTATNINLNTTQDTKIKGANLQATNQLNIDTKNLEVRLLVVRLSCSLSLPSLSPVSVAAIKLPVSWVCAWVLMLTCLAVMLVSSTVLLFSSALD